MPQLNQVTVKGQASLVDPVFTEYGSVFLNM